MESIQNRTWPVKIGPILVFIAAIGLLVVTLSSIPTPVSAENTEPVLNFYIERELSGHADDITSLAWSANGQWLASGSLDNTTIIWSTSSWSPIKTLNHPAPVHGVSSSKNSLRLAVSYGNGTVEVWNSIGWNLLKTLTDHTVDVDGLDWSPDATMLSTGDISGNILIWDAPTWSSLKSQDMPGAVNDVQWSNGGDRLAACSSDGTISIWDTSTWTYIQNLSVGGYGTESIAWSPDDTRLAAGSFENKVWVWDTVSWDVLHILDAHGTPGRLRWSPDDAYLASSREGGISAWDTSEWYVLDAEKTAEQSQIAALAIDPDSERIAAGSPENTDNNILIWEKNLSPVLDPIGNQTALEDQPFSLAITASDDDQLSFSDDSQLFDIDTVTGEILFVPTNDDVGDHVINISVTDGKGGSDFEVFTITVINVDDPPVAGYQWRYGADYVNITLRVGGQLDNSVTLAINEDETLIHELVVERQSGDMDEGMVHLLMNLSQSYELLLYYSGIAGTNQVAVTFERGGITYTQHYQFDSESGTEQVEILPMSDFFSAMGLVVFDATTSFDVDSEIAQYAWDFGDESKDEGIRAVHAFGENRNYNASLYIESDNGINSTVLFGIFMDDIPDKEALESILKTDMTLDYLEITNCRAVFIDTAKNLRLVDDPGQTTGWTGDSYSFDIEGVHLAQAFVSGEIYYIPNDLKLTYNIIDIEEDYEVDIHVPYTVINKRYIIRGDRGADALELSVDADTLTIYADEIQHNYSLRIEVQGAYGREIFTLTDMAIESGTKHHYTVNSWEDLTTDQKAVTLAIDNNDDGEIDVSIDLKNGMTGEDVEAIIVAKGEEGPSFLTTSGMILLIGFVSIAGIGCLLGSTEVGKLALLSLILPLYTRIRKEDVLDNEIRGMIRGYIIANPGDNYNSIKRALGLNNGTLAHHLKVLEKAELIKSRQDGMFRRFYPSGMRIPQENGGEIGEIQRIVLSEIAESPGISQKEIAVLLGLSKGVINYHVKVLLSKHLLKIEKRGRKTHCYLNSEATKLLRKINVLKTKEV